MVWYEVVRGCLCCLCTRNPTTKRWPRSSKSLQSNVYQPLGSIFSHTTSSSTLMAHVHGLSQSKSLAERTETSPSRWWTSVNSWQRPVRRIWQERCHRLPLTSYTTLVDTCTPAETPITTSPLRWRAATLFWRPCSSTSSTSPLLSTGSL